MTAHNNGQTVNYTSFGNSLGVSNTTVRNYIELLKGTFMVDTLPPFHKKSLYNGYRCDSPPFRPEWIQSDKWAPGIWNFMGINRADKY